MAADRLVDGRVLVANLGGAAIGGGNARPARPIAHRRHHLVERPFEVNGGWPRSDEGCIGALDCLVRGVRLERKRDAIGRRRPDQRRAAHLHRLDRARRMVERRQP